MNRRSIDIVTVILVVLNVLGFVYNFSKNGSKIIRGNESAHQLLDVGGMTGHTDKLTWLTSMFQHVSAVHIIMNMLSLVALAPAVALLYNQFEYFIGYFIAGLVGSFANTIYATDTVTVGASGAICGMMGMLLVGALISEQRRYVNLESVMGAVILMLVNTFMSRGISVSGHIGGLIGGVIVGLIFIVFQKLFKNRSQSNAYDQND